MITILINAELIYLYDKIPKEFINIQITHNKYSINNSKITILHFDDDLDYKDLYNGKIENIKDMNKSNESEEIIKIFQNIIDKLIK